MRETLSFTTDTATLAIFDLHAIAHRKSDTADWWSVPDDELDEINKGNIAGVFSATSYVAPSDNTIRFQGEVSDETCTVTINGNAANPVI